MGMRVLVLSWLVLCLTGAVQADQFYTVDEDMTAGYMTYRETDCSTWAGGSVWAYEDLRATPSGSTAEGDLQVLLQANTNTYDDNLTDPFWVNQTTKLGNKCMEASFYHEVDGLDGQAITFAYQVFSNELSDQGYTCRAFIKVLDAGAGWATTTYEWADLTAGDKNVLSIPGTVVTGSDPRVQVGFSIEGLNISSEDPIAELGVIVAPYRNKPMNPNPADGADVPLNLVSLSWTNMDTMNPADTPSCTVYLEKDPSNGEDPNMYSEAVATGVTDGMIVLADYDIELVDDGTPYKWRVDSLDPNTPGGGIPVVVGDTWHFSIGDVPPTNVDAGPDQYVWLENGTCQFILTGTYTDDDELSPVTVQWTDISNPLEQAPGTTVTINDPTEETTTVDVDGDGWFLFRFTASDDSGSAFDEVHVGVYVSPCKAAQEDPSDIPATYPDGQHGDIDGDCDIDLEDFAILASTWLDCMSEKLDCAP